MKRYIRIDIEYDADKNEDRGKSIPPIWTVMNNLHILIKEDMPYLNILRTRDTPIKDTLNEPFDYSK